MGTNNPRNIAHVSDGDPAPGPLNSMEDLKEYGSPKLEAVVRTVLFHLKHPYDALTFAESDGEVIEPRLTQTAAEDDPAPKFVVFTEFTSLRSPFLEVSSVKASSRDILIC